MTRQIDRTYFFNVLNTVRGPWLKSELKVACDSRTLNQLKASEAQLKVLRPLQKLLLEHPFASGKFFH